MELTPEATEKEARILFSQKATSMLNDKNRIAKAIAVYLRNNIEDFHFNYLSDEQMRFLIH